MEAVGGHRYRPADEPVAQFCPGHGEVQRQHHRENVADVIAASGGLAACICPGQQGRFSLRLVGHGCPRRRRSHGISVAVHRPGPSARQAPGNLPLERGNGPRRAHYQPPANHLIASATITSRITATTQPSPSTLPVPTVVDAAASGGAPGSPSASPSGSGSAPTSSQSGHQGSTSRGPPGVVGPKRKKVSKSQVPFSKTKSTRCGRGSPPSVTST